jgi:hypothetical protein
VQAGLAVAAQPGLHTCTAAARAGVADLCIDDPGDEVRISVDTGTGTILAIADRLLRVSPMYPHVAVGATVDSSTFVTGT